MKFTVRFTPTAETRFLEAIDRIMAEDPTAAVKFRAKSEKSLRRLELFPDSGRRIPEFPELPHREVIVSPYRFFYRVVGKSVWVVSVWHGAQLPGEP